MTKQNKNIRNRAKAKVITAMHQKGEKGPSKTQPKHTKRWTYRTNPQLAKLRAEALKATSGFEAPEKTSGKEILRKAGKAAKDFADKD